MATYVILANWTEAGIAAYKDSVKRADAFAKMIQKAGGKLRDIYWTVGSYDLVVTADAPDDETLAAVLLQLGAAGNVRTTTLRAFNKKEFAAIVERTD
jgi:uncharacterized protein with GYD domain